jgi:hypothetical protein
MHAPFGADALVVPRRLLADDEPFLVRGGAVKAVSFEEVVWADCPDRADDVIRPQPGVPHARHSRAAMSSRGPGGLTVVAHPRGAP